MQEYQYKTFTVTFWSKLLTRIITTFYHKSSGPKWGRGVYEFYKKKCSAYPKDASYKISKELVIKLKKVQMLINI